MGKRRTNVEHKTKYDGSDSDDSDEQQVEEAPLGEEKVAEIQSRKKLVAKRRALGSESSSSGSGPSPFSLFSKTAGGGESQEKSAAPVFGGFKGFSAYKPNVPAPQPIHWDTTTKNNTQTSSSSMKLSIFDKKETSTESKIDSPFLNGAKPLSETPAASFSIFNLQPKTNLSSSIFSKTNGEHKKDEVIEVKKADDTNKSINKNISESELKFITELNDLYERCYGSNKRTYKLPIDSLTESSESSSDQETKYACLLAELNKYCSKWISKHVEESPLVLLTPVFVDYFNYLILLEKHFFPGSFKKSEDEKIEKETVQKPSFFSSTLTNGSKLPVSGTNGHKENEVIIEDKAKENQEIFDSNKKVPSLFKASTQPFAPISLGTNTFDSFKSDSTNKPSVEKPSFFKPQSITETKQTEIIEVKESEKAVTTLTSQIKLPTITASFGFPVDKPNEEETKKDTETVTSKTYFASFNSNLSSTPLFKFGSTAPSSNTSISTPPSSENEKALEAKPEDTTKKPAEPVATEESKKFSFAPSPSGFFANLKKKGEEPKTTEEPQEKSAETQSKFKPISSTPFTFASTIPSTGGTASTAGQTPILSFGTGNKTSLFGSTPIGSTDTKSIFGSSPFGSTISPFGSAPIAAVGGGEGEAEEEPYEPPKPETSDVKEEGAVYEKRMKLYYYSEKEKKFVDRGIGNLFIKPTKSGESTQLIIRADTKLANILLNVKLTKLFPISKAGPKDVSYLCVPNPAIPGVSETTPCKFLFKVKTEDDANELLDKLNEYKK